MNALMMTLGYPEDSIEMLQEGERLARGLGDKSSLAKLYSGMGSYYVFKGNPTRATYYQENAFKEAEKEQDIELMAPIGFDLGLAAMTTGNYWKISEFAPRVIALLESTHRESDTFGRGFNLYSVMIAWYGTAFGFMGHFDKASEQFDKALRSAMGLNDLYGCAFTEFIYGSVYYVQGKMDDCVAHLEKAIKYGEEAQMVAILGSAWAMLGAGYHGLGELDSCRKCADKGLQILRDMDISASKPLCYEVLATHCLDTGDLDNARSYADEGLELAVKFNDKTEEGLICLLLGRVLARTDKSRYNEAEESIHKGMQLLEEVKSRPLHSRGYLYLGEIFADVGQNEKALENLRKAEAEFREMGMPYWLRRTQEVLASVES
jgi:tetratricopeptide (TPR) repeat protein